MKLSRITKPLRSVQVRVMLSGGLNASLERYTQYYEHLHGDTVDTRALIPEIPRAFLDADREFQSWSRSGGSNQSAYPPRLHSTAPPGSTGTCIIMVPADVNGMDPAPLWGTASMNGPGWYVDHHHSKARRVQR